MKYKDALNLLNIGYGVRRENWEEGNFIAFDEGKVISTKDGSMYYGRGYYSQKGKLYSTLDDLLSSEGIEDFKDDDVDNFKTAQIIIKF